MLTRKSLLCCPMMRRTHIRTKRPDITSQLNNSKPLGNLKTLIKGTHKAFKFGNQYLGTFAYRFSRRVDLQSLLCNFFGLAATISPTAERQILGMVEVHD